MTLYVLTGHKADVIMAELKAMKESAGAEAFREGGPRL